MAVSRWIDLGKNRWGGARLFEIAGVGAGFGVVRGSRLEDRGAEEEFDLGEVGFGVDTDGVVVGGFDVDGDVVFEEAELFEALGLFEEAGREGGEEVEGGAMVSVEADVFEVRDWS
jgi:hypothetical protein